MCGGGGGGGGGVGRAGGGGGGGVRAFMEATQHLTPAAVK